MSKTCHCFLGHPIASLRDCYDEPSYAEVMLGVSHPHYSRLKDLREIRPIFLEWLDGLPAEARASLRW